MKKKLFAAYLLLYNFIGITVAVGGWLWEVLLFLVKEGQFANRGFLYGPWLPVYGVGAVILSVVFYQKDIAAIITYAYFGTRKYPKDFYHGHLYARLQWLIQQMWQRTPSIQIRPIKHYRSQIWERRTRLSSSVHRIKTKNRLAENTRIFLICMFGGGLIELAVGWFLEHVFHQKYWDYTGYFLNISGYVCLFSALGFGIFGLLWIKWIAPHLIRIWEKVRFAVQILVIGALDMLLAADAVFALMEPNAGENITFSFLLARSL